MNCKTMPLSQEHAVLAAVLQRDGYSALRKSSMSDFIPGVPVYRSHFQRTAGHPPAGVPLRTDYNPDATPTPHVPGYGGDVRRVPTKRQQDWQVERLIQSLNQL